MAIQENLKALRILSNEAPFIIRCVTTKQEVAQLEAKGIVHAIRSQEDMQEATGTYKDIEMVIANEADLVKVLTRLLPIAVINE